MPELSLQALSPFGGLPFASAPGRGVIAIDRASLAIARVISRKDCVVALCQRMRERFGIDLPLYPVRVEADGVAFVGVGVESWLAVSDGDPAGFAALLRSASRGLASIADQSGGYAVLRVTGPHVRHALAKFVAVDVHDRAFRPQAAASTAAAQIGITLWRLADLGADPVFEIAVPRSLAGTFWQVLTSSAADYGFAFGTS
jgi:heterotetrameric sarcosine oxidase gamma subunit